MALSSYLANQVIAWVRGTNMPAAPATIYISLHTAGGAELTGNGYARIPAAAWGAITVGGGEVSVSNSSAVTTPTATGAWLEATHFRLNDAATAGNALSSLTALTEARTVAENGRAEFGSGAFTFSVPTTTASVYLATQVCEWISGVAFPAAPTTCHVGWHDAGGTEVSGNGYARGPITWGAAEDTGVAIRCRNSAVVTGGTATANWVATPNVAIYDALSAGNALSSVVSQTSVSITAGGYPQVRVDEAICLVPYAA